MADRFTPGPWCVENVNSEEGYEHDICLGYDVPKAGSPILLASVYFDEEHDGPITQRQANWNAKLIAAAPDLLAACVAYQAAVSGCSHMPRCECQDAAGDMIRDAIAKATGR